MEHEDEATVVGTETLHVKTYTQEEVDALIRESQKPNLTPAYEVGPHLLDPDIRAGKRKQMLDHGWTGDEDHLTPDMIAILKEAE